MPSQAGLAASGVEFFASETAHRFGWYLLALASGVLTFVFPTVVWFGIGVPVGIMLLLVCIAALSVVMLREAGRVAALPGARALA